MVDKGDVGFVDQDQGDAFVGAADCNDILDAISPAATESCDGYDTDCNGSTNYSDSAGGDTDADADGFVDCNGDGAGYTDQDPSDAMLGNLCQVRHIQGMSTMNVSLPDGLKSFVDEQVTSRGYSTCSE